MVRLARSTAWAQKRYAPRASAIVTRPSLTFDTKVHASVLRSTGIRLAGAYLAVCTIADSQYARGRHIHRPEKAGGRLGPQFSDGQLILSCPCVIGVAFDQHLVLKILDQPAA